MGIIATKDFNRDLTAYVNKKRSSESGGLKLKFNFGGKKETSSVGSLEAYDEQPAKKKSGGLFGGLFSSSSKEEDVNPEELSQEEMAKLAAMTASTQASAKPAAASPGLRHPQLSLRKPEPKMTIKQQPARQGGLFSKLGFGRQQDDEEVVMESAEPVLDTEAIEVLKLTGRWLNKLSPEEKKNFKDSSDYLKYKAFLDKHNLTKKQ